MSKVLMKGNEAIGEAAIRAGCLNYFAYPITPQTEVAEYLSKRMAEVDGVFLQGESEVAVSYMIFGAAAAGARIFTTSSSPGISLMSEGISYMAGAQCPAVFVNIMRGGPGLGGILPSQADYWQATKSIGHGDFRLLVMAPASVQEAVEMMMDAFPLAEKYRNPVMILGDGLIGQMMEPVEFPTEGSPPLLEFADLPAQQPLEELCLGRGLGSRRLALYRHTGRVPCIALGRSGLHRLQETVEAPGARTQRDGVGLRSAPAGEQPGLPGGGPRPQVAVVGAGDGFGTRLRRCLGQDPVDV